jgi:hypothetical protein
LGGLALFAAAFLVSALFCEVGSKPPTQVSRVKSDIMAIEGALADFKATFGRYPPSRITLYTNRQSWNSDPRSPVSAQAPKNRAKAKSGILPPNKQQKQKGVPGAALERFLQLSPEQRRQALAQLPPARRRLVMQRLQTLELLSPEELRLLRGRYQAFIDLPAERRQALREEIRTLRALERPARRQRLTSPEVRDRYSEEELQLLCEVSGMPDQPE